MITKELEVDKIEVVGLWNVQVRTATVVKEDDVEISRSLHRHVLTPDSDMSEEDPRVVAVAEAAWTPEVRASFDAFKEAQTDGVG